MASLTQNSAEMFASTGNHILRIARRYSDQTMDRRFRSMFGVTPNVCAKLWDHLRNSLPASASPKHLLWALMFLKVYASEHVNSVLAGADEKTYRKWVWTMVEATSNLRLIQWSHRNINRQNNVYRASVDGVDFVIEEPTPFDPMWYSHKHNGPGLRYEVAVGIGSGNICWAFGPFPYGRFNDLKIYRLRLKQLLDDNQKIVADGGYKDPTCSFGTPKSLTRLHGFYRARHEAVNKRIRSYMKQFHVLGRRFRHRLRKHWYCFHAVANLTFLMIQSGEPIFQ